jgi:hypothetical protein
MQTTRFACSCQQGGVSLRPSRGFSPFERDRALLSLLSTNCGKQVQGEKTKPNESVMKEQDYGQKLAQMQATKFL